VGSPVGITLQDLATLVAQNFKPSPEIMFNTSLRKLGRSAQLLPDTTHAKNEYGLSVFTPLDEAVKLTAQWHRMQSS
jgi:nucleoside-diphosphate-sugar epimerase